MPNVSLPFYRQGEPFDPAVSLQDLEDYEKKEQAVLRGPMLGVLRFRTEFLQGVLKRDMERRGDEGKLKLNATANQVHEAVRAIIWTQALGEEQLPLVSAGAASKSAKPEESASPSASPASTTPEALEPTRPA